MIIVIIVIIGPIFLLTLCTALFITLGNWYHSSSLAISWFSWLMNHEITIITTFLFSQKVTRYTKYTIIATLVFLRKVMREADEKLTINK